MSSKPYKLDKPYGRPAKGDGPDEGACIFCGKMTTHVNDGGNGWILEAGDRKAYLYCSNPQCAEVEAHDAAHLHRCHGGDLDPSKIYDACDDFGSYLEYVGDTCPCCDRPPTQTDARLYDPTWTEFFAKGALDNAG